MTFNEWNLLNTYTLAKDTSFAKGFSQVYILITWIPEIISFINRTRSSVRIAVFNLNIDVRFPNQAEINKIILINLFYDRCTLANGQKFGTPTLIFSYYKETTKFLSAK